MLSPCVGCRPRLGVAASKLVPLKAVWRYLSVCKWFLSLFPVLLLDFQTYAQCPDPVVVKATQTDAEGKIALAVSGGVAFEARNTRSSLYKYRWTDKAGKLLSEKKEVSGLAPGTYTVEVSDNSACKTVNTYTLKGLAELSISVERLYFLDTRLVGTSSLSFSITNPGNANLEVSNITFPKGFSAVEWSGGTIAPGKTQVVKVSFKPTDTRVYTGFIEVISNAGSGKNRLEVSGRGILVTGTEKPAFAYLRVFPNPASERLHLELPAGMPAADVQLVDNQGRVLYRQQGAKGPLLSIDLSGYASNVYTLVLQTCTACPYHSRRYGAGNGSPKIRLVQKVIIKK